MKERLDTRLFQYGLILGIVYQLYQSLNTARIDDNLFTVAVNFVIALILIFLYVLTPRIKNVQFLVFILHFIVLAGFIYFWKNYGGYAGTVPSFMCLYFAFIIALSKGIYQMVFLGIYAVALLLLMAVPSLFGIENNYDLSKIPPIQRNLDYFIVACLTAFFIVYLKKQLHSFQNRISDRYMQLKKVSSTLAEQNEELNQQQDELTMINENLESIVRDRIAEIEKKNRDLSEYAFINAHLVRGPLSRVIGITSLILRETTDETRKKEIQAISYLAGDIDKVVRKISEVVS